MAFANTHNEISDMLYKYDKYKKQEIQKATKKSIIQTYWGQHNLVTMKIHYMVTIILICVSLNLVGQKSNVDSLKLRIENLEKKIEQLDSQKDIHKQPIENESGDLKTQLNEYKNQSQQELTSVKSTLQIVIFGGGIALIAFFVWFFLFLTKKAKQITESKINEKISTVVDDNASKILKLVEAHNFESKLLKEARIVVLYSSIDGFFYFKKLMEKLKFTRFELVECNEYKSYTNRDLVIFDDHRNLAATNYPYFIDCMALPNNKKTMFLFFSPSNKLDNNQVPEAAKDKLNYANSKYTLFAQIINSLRFQ